jgi:hypothetical protein
VPPRSSSFPSCVAFWKVGESAKNIDKVNPQSLVPIFSSSCSCRRNFGSHDPCLFVTVLQSAHPAAASLLGREEEANHFVSETLSTTVQLR